MSARLKKGADLGRTAEDALARALVQLTEEARRELARHPQGHWIQGPESSIDLNLTLPLDPAHDGLASQEQVQELRRQLRSELDALVAHRSALRPGRVPNLRTGEADGEDTAPYDSRFVFGGYSPSGRPRFLEFGQWLLQLDHERVDELYRKPPPLIAVGTPGADLYRELIDAFDDRGPADYRIEGQVTAGWYQAPRQQGPPAPLAVTFLVVSTLRPGVRRRRYGLNLLGAGPDGEPLEEVTARLDGAPWQSAVAWAQQALTSIESAQGRKGGAKGLSRRIDGVLGGLARRLEQQRRSRDRRTDHAESRHRGGERPTSMALQDLAQANDQDFLVDRRHETVIVLGERGRAHVWSRRGKLVTSIRYSPDSIERKRKLEIWRPATAQEANELRKAVGV